MRSVRIKRAGSGRVVNGLSRILSLLSRGTRRKSGSGMEEGWKERGVRARQTTGGERDEGTRGMKAGREGVWRH